MAVMNRRPIPEHHRFLALNVRVKRIILEYNKWPEMVEFGSSPGKCAFTALDADLVMWGDGRCCRNRSRPLG
jgi:hypothetical protein